MESDIYKQWYEFEKDHWWTMGMRRMCGDMLNRFCTSQKDVAILDIGCGTGGLTRTLGHFGNVYGADISEEAVAFCKKRGIRGLVRTSAENAGFKRNSFSTIIAFCLIEHIAKEEAFLKEMHRILKKDGHLVILTSAFQFLWSRHDDLAHHKRRYTSRSLKQIMQESDFSIKKLSYVNSFLFPGIAAIRIMQRYGYFCAPKEDRFLLDVFYVPRLLNKILYRILRIESKMLKFINFPFGVGLICVGKKH
ncbi:MAG: class I SAM-dependent methyltransferase [Candidatus Omnitrophota bacterium]